MSFTNFGSSLGTVFSVGGPPGPTGATGPAPSGNPGDMVYLISSGVAGATANVSYTGDGSFYVGSLATLSNLYVPGAANIEHLSVSNLLVTGNLYVTATNVQTTNALTINNSGTTTALKVIQNETSIHTHNVAEFWDATTLAMVIDPEGNVAIHTASSPGYALTVTDPANFETLYIRGKAGQTTLNVNGNVFVSNALTVNNVFETGIQTIAGLAGRTTLTVTGNVFVSNAVTATNVFATRLNLTTALAVTSGGTGTTTSTGTGSVVLSNAPTLTGTTNVATLTASGNITSLSDRRIKKDIKRIEGALDKVIQIGGYTFTRTDESNKDQRQSGVIAQEMIKVLPEVVQISEETGYYSVSYGNITALLIEALKEERIERLKLEERLARLEN